MGELATSPTANARNNAVSTCRIQHQCPCLSFRTSSSVRSIASVVVRIGRRSNDASRLNTSSNSIQTRLRPRKISSIECVRCEDSHTINYRREKCRSRGLSKGAGIVQIISQQTGRVTLRRESVYESLSKLIILLTGEAIAPSISSLIHPVSLPT